MQARYDELRDFASKISQENLSQESKTLYDSFVKSLDNLSYDSISLCELNNIDKQLSEYLLQSELADINSAKDIILPYFSAKYHTKSENKLAQIFGEQNISYMRQALEQSRGTKPLVEFDTNYAEFYLDGKVAISKLLAQAQEAKQAGKDFNAQVARAFSRKELGEIDLVWENEKMGLQKIIQKHLNDFANFSGTTPQEKLANGLSEIVSRWDIAQKDGVKTIWLTKDNKNYVVGLSKGWKGNGENI